MNRSGGLAALMLGLLLADAARAGCADLVVCNIHLAVMREILPELERLGAPLLLSGFLVEQIPELTARLRVRAQRVRDGAFGTDGELPLNTHGGLLSFGHSGAAGGMAHIAEAYRQLAGRAGNRQIAPRRRALLHADGGVLSAHVSLILERRG